MKADGIHSAFVNIKSPPAWLMPIANKIYETIYLFAEYDFATPTIADFCYVTRESEYAVRTALNMLQEGELIVIHEDSKSNGRYRRFEIPKTGKMTATRKGTKRRRVAA